MRTLFIKPVGQEDIYKVDYYNIYKVFSELTYEARLYIVEESVKDFLLTMLNPDSYKSEAEFHWEGNSFYPAMDAWFE